MYGGTDCNRCLSAGVVVGGVALPGKGVVVVTILHIGYGKHIPRKVVVNISTVEGEVELLDPGAVSLRLHIVLVDGDDDVVDVSQDHFLCPGVVHALVSVRDEPVKLVID